MRKDLEITRKTSLNFEKKLSYYKMFRIYEVRSRYTQTHTHI